MRKLFAVLVAGSMLTLGGVAQAAPVATSAVLGVAIQGLAPLTVGGAGTVSVTGSTVIVPAGIAALVGTIIVPVTGSTAIDTLSIMTLSNLSGTFSLGGVTAQAGAEICSSATPLVNGSTGLGCNVGGGIGGRNVHPGVDEGSTEAIGPHHHIGIGEPTRDSQDCREVPIKGTVDP